ncbi:hypothetical protein ACX0HA_09130 [Flavobacterium hauense]
MNKPEVQSIVAQLPYLNFEESKHFYVNTLDRILVKEFDDLIISLNV